MRYFSSLFNITIFALVLLLSAPGSQAWQGTVAGDAFTQAVDAYNANRFTDAQNLFSTVTGAHAQEAKAYLDKIRSYRDALETAQTMLNRSPDEMDSGSLQFAIRQIQQAIAIKPDGPYHPGDLLAKAKALQAKVAAGEQASAASRDQDFCRKALDAAKAHRYKDAARLSCLVANDNPGFACGGDEAVHVCQQMEELEASHPAGGSAEPPAQVAASDKSDQFEKARVAYEANDFDQAKKLFQRVTGDQKPEAGEYLDKIERYRVAMEHAAKLLRAADYQDARLAYREAAGIKPGGPGKPEEQAAIVDLQQGIDEFYSGHYAEAQQYLSTYNQENPQKPDLAHFYAGASKLAQFYLTGGQDAGLHDGALDEFRQARKAGFSPNGQPVSPKILSAYQEAAD